MSDSGRQVGDCPHARTRSVCPDCLHDEADDLRRKRDELAATVRDVLARVDQWGDVGLEDIARLRDSLARCTP